MGLKEVGIFGRLWMQGLQDQQEPTGTTFHLGKHAYGGALVSPWDTGGLQGFFSCLVVHLSVCTCPLWDPG